MEGKRLSLEDVQRIIDAVDDGKEKISPDDIDKEALANELTEFAEVYLGASAINKKKLDRLTAKIRKSAEFLLSVFDLKADKPPSHYLMHLALFPHHGKGVLIDGDEERFNVLISSLQRLTSLPSIAHDDGSDRYIFLKLFLSPTYERHFHRRAATSRPSSGGKPYGPYVRFVEAVCAEFGLKISAETIDAYL